MVMIVVYVDLLVIEDLILNYIILLSVSILLNRLSKLKKIFLASVAGLIPLVFIFLEISSILLFIIILIFAFIMSIISFGYKDIIYTFKNIIYMYFISIFMAGFLYLVNIYYKVDNYILYLLISPIITYIFIRSMNLIKNNYSNYYKLDIYFKDKPMIMVNAYLDTGNNLADPYFHKPVILLSKNIIDVNDERIILVPYNTIDNHSLIKCIKPDKIYIHNIGYRKRLLIGIVDEVGIEGADCILNKRLLERI